MLEKINFMGNLPNDLKDCNLYAKKKIPDNERAAC